MNYAVDDILLRLRNAKALVSVDGQQLKIDVESGVIDEELKTLIRQHKAELVDVITRTRKSPAGSHTIYPAQPAVLCAFPGTAADMAAKSVPGCGGCL